MNQRLPTEGSLLQQGEERLYYVTVLSNFARCYDKYHRIYDKVEIPESTFPDKFFLLRREELAIGVTKALHLLKKTGLPGDRLIAIETRACTQELRPNTKSGLGRYVERGHLTVEAVHFVEEPDVLRRTSIEEASALSHRMHARSQSSFETLSPRSVSILPVARACQACCPFCFSRASVSEDTLPMPLDWDRTSQVLNAARDRGAQRAVITGGGEPSLLRDCDLQRLIREATACFSKVVLISNGHTWARKREDARAAALARLAASGLSVLAISRHHFDRSINAQLMGLDTCSDELASTWSKGRNAWPGLKLRWICVLQRGGVDDRHALEQYLTWAAQSGVDEVCFKELYVAASVESEYYNRSTNQWSAMNQIPLRLVLDLAHDCGWSVRETLPWGAPVFEGQWDGKPMSVAAYTEPSPFWELSNGIARSWNLLADGRCLSSLEDRRSEVLTRGLSRLQAMA